MLDAPHGQVAIVDYGMGNLFSVKQACEQEKLRAVITASGPEIMAADAVILPGVGAFGDAMATLEKLDLVSVLRDVAASSKPLVGICLGMQLLMSESQEFGRRQGLGIVEGEVVRFDVSDQGANVLKVPQVGWNRIHAPVFNRPSDGPSDVASLWKGSLIDGLADGEYMYFVHSYYAKPVNRQIVMSVTPYGQIKFCSSLRSGNVFGCQFHPERSGQQGLRVYRNLAKHLLAISSEVKSA